MIKVATAKEILIWALLSGFYLLTGLMFIDTMFHISIFGMFDSRSSIEFFDRLLALIMGAIFIIALPFYFGLYETGEREES